ncbi:MAG: ribulose-phosphate 3-epimerase [Anaerolineae bacterium]
MIKISPSIMCADFKNLGATIRELDAAGADLYHFDIMDGHFVPNFTMGPAVIESLRDVTDHPFETHLMIEYAERYIDDMAAAGSDIITVHVEACVSLHRTVYKIKKAGCQAAVAVNPSTPLHSLEYILPELSIVVLMTVDPGFVGQPFTHTVLSKIRALRQIIEEQGLSIDIQVDGSINKRTIPSVVQAGANVLVVGTSGLFGVEGGFRSTIKAIREQAQRALEQKAEALIGEKR